MKMHIGALLVAAMLSTQIAYAQSRPFDPSARNAAQRALNPEAYPPTGQAERQPQGDPCQPRPRQPGSYYSAEGERLAAQARCKAEREWQDEKQRQLNAAAAAKEAAEKRAQQEEAVRQQQAAEAPSKGEQYVRDSGTKWTLKQKDNPMTDKVDVTVESGQDNGTGGVAIIEGRCADSGGTVALQLSALIVDSDGKGVGLPNAGENALGKNGINGTLRINDGVAGPNFFPTFQFANKFIIGTLKNVDTTWRVLAQVDSTKGPILIKVSMFDQNIRKVINSCESNRAGR